MLGAIHKISFGLIFLGALIPQPSSAESNFVIGYRESPSPYFILQDGVLVDGATKDLGDLLQEKLRIDISYKRVSRKEREPALRNKEIDAFCFWRPRNAEAADELHWTVPILEIENIFIYLKDSPWKIQELKDIAGMRLGTIEMHSYSYIQEMLDRGLVTRHDERWISKNIDKLFAGEIDAIISSNFVSKYRLKKRGATDRVQYYEEDFGLRKLQCAISKKSDISIQKVNGALQEILEEGSFAARLTKYH